MLVCVQHGSAIASLQGSVFHGRAHPGGLRGSSAWSAPGSSSRPAPHSRFPRSCFACARCASSNSARTSARPNLGWLHEQHRMLRPYGNAPRPVHPAMLGSHQLLHVRMLEIRSRMGCVLISPVTRMVNPRFFHPHKSWRARHNSFSRQFTFAAFHVEVRNV